MSITDVESTHYPFRSRSNDTLVDIQEPFAIEQ